MELAAALAVLLIVALLAGPGDGHRKPTPQPRWAARESAALTALIGDLTAVERDAAAAGQPAGNWATALQADNGRLAADVNAARSLQGGPTASFSNQWSAALAQIGPVVEAADRVVGDAAGTPARLQADIQSLGVASRAAGDALLRLAALLGP